LQNLWERRVPATGMTLEDRNVLILQPRAAIASELDENRESGVFD